MRLRIIPEKHFDLCAGTLLSFALLVELIIIIMCSISFDFHVIECLCEDMCAEPLGWCLGPSSVHLISLDLPSELFSPGAYYPPPCDSEISRLLRRVAVPCSRCSDGGRERVVVTLAAEPGAISVEVVTLKPIIGSYGSSYCDGFGVCWFLG